MRTFIIAIVCMVAACTDPAGLKPAQTDNQSLGGEIELCTPQDAESGLCIPSWVQLRARNESRVEAEHVAGGPVTYAGAGCVSNQGLNQIGCQVSFEYDNRTYYVVCIWQLYDDGTSSVSCTSGSIGG